MHLREQLVLVVRAAVLAILGLPLRRVNEELHDLRRGRVDLNGREVRAQLRGDERGAAARLGGVVPVPPRGRE